MKIKNIIADLLAFNTIYNNNMKKKITTIDLTTTYEELFLIHLALERAKNRHYQFSKDPERNPHNHDTPYPIPITSKRGMYLTYKTSQDLYEEYGRLSDYVDGLLKEKEIEEEDKRMNE